MAKRLKLFYSALLITATIFATMLPGCSKKNTDGSEYIFEYDLSANPRTLDPQTATNSNERVVIANLFDGLLRMDENGNITYAIANEYSISSDSLTYTFNLRDDVFWSDKDGFLAQCTAHDFVFAFRRLFSPDVNSQNASDYFAIFNSSKIYNGELSPNNLGVVAKDDFTLIITLEHPDSLFTILLTAPPSFPCNEKYYLAAEGRYGLLTVHGDFFVPSNTGLYLRNWYYDPWWTEQNHLLLRRKQENSPDSLDSLSYTQPRGVNFYMDRGNPVTHFADSESDCIIMSGDTADELIKKNYPYKAAENSVLGITFGKKGENQDSVFADENLRLALALATSLEAVTGFSDSTGYKKTPLIIPEQLKIENHYYRDLADGLVPLSPDSAKAKQHFNMSAHLVDSLLREPILIVPIYTQNEETVTLARAVVQQWQEKLSLFCKIEALELSEFEKRYNNGDFDIAITKITAQYNSPFSILEQIADISPIFGTAEELASYYAEKENEVLQSAEFIPLVFVSEYFFTGKSVEGLVYNAFTGEIDFRRGRGD